MAQVARHCGYRAWRAPSRLPRDELTFEFLARWGGIEAWMVGVDDEAKDLPTLICQFRHPAVDHGAQDLELCLFQRRAEMVYALVADVAISGSSLVRQLPVETLKVFAPAKIGALHGLAEKLVSRFGAGIFLPVVWIAQ